VVFLYKLEIVFVNVESSFFEGIDDFIIFVES
jgi:hypothetical protein